MPLWEQWRLAFDDRMPIYRQIILRFNQAFVSGNIQAGERIPSIRELSALLKVNTNTIQRVYQEMERSEMINSKRGTGYFFTEDRKIIEKTRRNLEQESLNRFVGEMRALGCDDTEIINKLEVFMKGGKKHADNSRNLGA
jgi:GntR family transcriptional regulator